MAAWRMKIAEVGCRELRSKGLTALGSKGVFSSGMF
jgi:hypothetical protein